MLLIGLTASIAAAGGKLTLQNNLYNNGTTYRPTVGFSVYQPLLKGLAFNRWKKLTIRNGSSPRHS
jgi:hypothetical protein